MALHPDDSFPPLTEPGDLSSKEQLERDLAALAVSVANTKNSLIAFYDDDRETASSFDMRQISAEHGNLLAFILRFLLAKHSVGL